MTVTDDTTADDTAEWVEDTDDDETTATADDDESDDTTATAGDEHDDEQDEDGQPKKGVRARLKEAEEERDELRSQLSWSRQVAFMECVHRAGAEPDLMTAAGLKVEDFLDENGAVDSDALTAAVDVKAGALGVPRRPKPVSAAGRGGGDEVKPPETFGAILAEHAKRNRPS